MKAVYRHILYMLDGSANCFHRCFARLFADSSSRWDDSKKLVVVRHSDVCGVQILRVGRDVNFLLDVLQLWKEFWIFVLPDIGVG